MNTAVTINSLPLPIALLDALETGIWQTPNDLKTWYSLFPQNEVLQPQLYSLSGMAGETEWLVEAGPAYWGRRCDAFNPGNVDPARTVLIGDLGPDRLIALDYRESTARPAVVALTSDENSCWKRVADDIETLIRLILVKQLD